MASQTTQQTKSTSSNNKLFTTENIADDSIDFGDLTLSTTSDVASFLDSDYSLNKIKKIDLVDKQIICSLGSDIEISSGDIVKETIQNGNEIRSVEALDNCGEGDNRSLSSSFILSDEKEIASSHNEGDADSSFIHSDFTDSDIIENKHENIKEIQNATNNFSNDINVKNSTIITGFKTGNNRNVRIKEESLLNAKKVSIAIEKDEMTSFMLQRNKPSLNTKKTETENMEFQNMEVQKENNRVENEQENIGQREIGASRGGNSLEGSFSFSDKDTFSDDNYKTMQLNNVNDEGSKVNKLKNVIDIKKQQLNALNTNIEHDTKCVEKEHYRVGGNEWKRSKSENINQLAANKPIRMYNKPERGHISNDIKYIEKMQETFDFVKNKYKKQEVEWIKNNFKWSWAYLYTCKKITDSTNNLRELIVYEMEKRRVKEYSIFRRIVEGDDISRKYMIVLVLKINGKNIEIFDGFYTLLATVDLDLSKMLISQRIRFGTFLRVVNAELLCEPKSIFSMQGNALKLNYNSTKVTKPQELGYQRKTSFCTFLNRILRTGGVISAVELKIVRIVNIKILVKLGNYINTVNETDLDKELEKLEHLVTKAENTAEYKLIIKKTANVIASDKLKTECLLIWLDCEDVKVNNIFRFFNLKAIEKSMGLHLGTVNNKSSFYRIKDFG